MISKLKYSVIVLLLLIASTIVNAVAQSIATVIKTNKGYIRGVTENGIAVFKGIPYAAPPVGSLRFKLPVEHAGWTDTLSAEKFSAIASQFSGGKVVGSEDCLSLNVYTPKADNHKRAVVVWVHGGSMTAGAGRGEDGHAFADRDDIVTVTINYRLGVFGFLYLGDVDKDYTASGDNGLLDCVAALSWIKQNIAAFGGDPNRVTLMGESAGAKLISAVLVSPKSKGLFQQYIAESGSVQCIRSLTTAQNERLRILRQLGLAEKDGAKLLTMSADSLIKAQAKVCEGLGGNSFFGPVNDGAVITGDPYQYASGKSFPHIKALVGTNREEAALFISIDDLFKQADTITYKALFGDNFPVFYRTYKKELEKTEQYAASVKTLTQYMYQMHTYRFAKAMAQHGTAVWMYRFDYDKGPLGAAHATELPFVWYDNKPIPDAAKRQLTKEMHASWVAFIKTGNPNTPGLPLWPNYNDKNRQVLLLDTKPKVIGLKEVFDDKDFPQAVFVLK